ncbi:deoxynucleotidyltransferase terminal-interacting protein 2 [Ischnura elegans]|uniref:deoxynucleotidyltransferase terminal-interacting protein 2 n=1 Tax=Ischnura elegans TaxID=197161 RepID=UPI001ED8A948|nr:deoxynucleotidyltransferase terminal-interacting protein 2 [Ischnura elegans]
MDIVIDTKGEFDVLESSSGSSSEEEESESETDEECESFMVPYRTSVSDKGTGNRTKDSELDLDTDTYLDVGFGKTNQLTGLAQGSSTRIEEIMKKSVITPGFEKLDAIPPYEESKRQLVKKRREERAKTKGKDWFNLPAPDVTEEMKHDLEVLRMRSVLDPKHFYKKNDLKVLPKYFQVGRIVEGPADFYNSRVPKKQRKQTIVEELMADAEFKRYNKRKFKEIIASSKAKSHLKAHMRSKKLKKKK